MGLVSRFCLAWLLVVSWALPLLAQDANPVPAVLRTFATGADGEKLMLSPPVVSKDGSRIAFHVTATPAPGGRAVVYDVATGNKVHEMTARGEELSVEAVALSPDGRRAAFVTRHADLSSSLNVVDLATGKTVYRCAPTHGYPIVWFTPDGQRLLHDRPQEPFEDPEQPGLALTALETGRVVGRFSAEQWHRLNGVFSPDGQRVVTVDASTHVVKVWNLADSKLVSTMQMGEHDSQRALMFMPGGQSIRGVNARGVVQTWDAETGMRLSRSEPQELIRVEAGSALSKDGKTLLIIDYGGIEFRDADTGKPLGLWRHGPQDSSIAYADTVRGDTVVVNVEGATQRGDLAVVRLPNLRDLAPPIDARKAREAARVRLSGTTSAAVAVPRHRDADLREPSWWLDRAEAEWSATTDEDLRRRVVAALVVARAAAGDDLGLERMMTAAAALYPNDTGWPMDEVRVNVARYRARRLVRSGKVAEAIEVAKAVAGPHAQSNRAVADVAVEQALAGDVEGAVVTSAALDESFAGRTLERAVRMLLVAGKLVEAEGLAARIADPHWLSTAFDRVAEAKARGGDVDGALAALGRVEKNRYIGAARKVIRALAERRLDEGARRVIASLPAAQQGTAWSWLARGQLDRDDLDAAVSTSKQLSGNAAYDFRTWLATAQARLGRTQEAVAAAMAVDAPGELRPAVFGELVRGGRLDAAADLVVKSPRPRAGTDPEAASRGYRTMLARAMADAGRIADAERLLALTPPRADRRDEHHEAAAWAIAAAKRRAADAAGYAAAHQPLLDAVRTAAGGPSRATAQFDLLRFQIATGDFASAEALLPTMEPELYRGVAMALAMELDGKARGGDAARGVTDLGRGRALVRLTALIVDRPLTGNMMATIARAHAQGGTFEEWIEWTRSLPTTVSRVVAYEAMADSLLPADPEEPRD